MSQRSRLIWRCRRGIREMDILLLGYLETHYDTATVENQNTFEELLEENDLDILSWMMEKTSPDEKYIKLIKFIRESATNSKDNSNK
ncbi:MAG: succinate dehydrogenase assembly factor 2 [Gammaproteobacteria bacterium]|nr:succinate dehydrogenase assembly factor 2 [Gammaproteobacteria bacterium]MCK5498258.1 succinate dehydrogenase assembly factor 2 [Gammaproteobacteria bacterium]MCK5669151.1 succinate dehydrogenase assembly factor 2 [Gammaproteobacteria bacterium]